MLPGIKSYATCIRFNPYLYSKLNPAQAPELPTSKTGSTDAEFSPLLDLPYRIVFAVATTDQVLIYNTESIYPMAVLGSIHYAPINDMAWVIPDSQPKSQKLVVSSSDGFCSIVSFDNDFRGNRLLAIGERLPLMEVPEKLRAGYEALDQVNFKKYEAEVLENAKKGNQYKTIQVVSKLAQA